MDSMETEVPWFNRVPEATLTWSEPEVLGHLRFVDPKGNTAVVHVTTGPTRKDQNFNVWHIDVAGDLATVSPSVHYVGQWHTPNPVQFSLVETLG